MPNTIAEPGSGTVKFTMSLASEPFAPIWFSREVTRIAEPGWLSLDDLSKNPKLVAELFTMS